MWKYQAPSSTLLKVYFDITPSERVPGLVVDFRSTKTFTPVMPLGNIHSNDGLLSVYHLAGSGCVGEETFGAAGVLAVGEAFGASSAAVVKLKEAVPKPDKILVPSPSLAKT